MHTAAKLTTNIDVRRDGNGVVEVFLNRPERKNAMLPEMWGELAGHFYEIERRVDDRVVVLRGHGVEFSSGADMKVHGGDEQNAMSSEAVMAAVKTCVLSLFELSVPTIAAVDGVAVGGGANLALACDLVVATDRARFSQIFVRRGLAVDTGGSWLLPRLVGLGRAKRLVLLGDIIDASAAFELGLVARVVPPAALDDAVAEWTCELLEIPTPAVAASKRLLNGSADITLAEALDAESASQLEMGRSPHFAEMVQAFLDKRGGSGATA